MQVNNVLVHYKSTGALRVLNLRATEKGDSSVEAVFRLRGILAYLNFNTGDKYVHVEIINTPIVYLHWMKALTSTRSRYMD